MAAGLQESSVAHLDDLAPDSPAHFAGQVQAGVCLIHGVTLRTGEVDEVAAVLQHLRAAGLFPCLVRQVSGGDGSAGGHGVAADIGVDEPHGHILGEGKDSIFLDIIYAVLIARYGAAVMQKRRLIP